MWKLNVQNLNRTKAHSIKFICLDNVSKPNTINSPQKRTPTPIP